ESAARVRAGRSDEGVTLIGILQRWSAPSRRLYLTGLAVVVMTILTAGLVIWDGHEQKIEHFQAEMTKLNVVLAEQTARSIQAIDLVLRETQAKVSAAAAASDGSAPLAERLATPAMHEFFVARLQALPQVEAIGLVGPDGRLVAGSRQWPTQTLDV